MLRRDPPSTTNNGRANNLNLLICMLSTFSERRSASVSGSPIFPFGTALQQHSQTTTLSGAFVQTSVHRASFPSFACGPLGYRVHLFFWLPLWCHLGFLTIIAHMVSAFTSHAICILHVFCPRGIMYLAMYTQTADQPGTTNMPLCLINI